ncbi:alkaline phosphatase [Flavobacteriaceae bacterium Ap0902]|nr:alkaline phosphatase [Flavobacteriaceae bacterium Ap0902]
MKFKILSVLLLCYTSSFAQSQIHSHNDYQQTVPFWEAYAHGATSIETDVFLKDGKLFVAHEEQSIQPNKTLEQLYLYPIMQVFEYHVMEAREIQWMIDIKSEAKTTLQAIIKALKPYQSNFYPNNPNGVKLIISGNRPDFKNYNDYPNHIFFDWQSDEIPTDLSKIAMLSLDFANYSVWNGKGKIVTRENIALKEIIEKAKNRRLPIRFWNNPDSKSGWYALDQLGVDYIGTDQPAKAEAYFKNLKRNTVQIPCGVTRYQPTYQSDNANKPIKNVVLIIGDGMGQAQISSATIFCPDMILNQFKSIGFSKTNSANDYTTDSAAGGTAIAMGEKTNNRAVGVDVDYKAQPNLVEILSKEGFKTAILTTDEITGATPADFYAHVRDRGMKDEIAQDLIQSDLDFFMGGDRRFFRENGFNEALEEKGFTVVDTITNLSQSANKIAFFAGENSLPYIREGRGDLLPKATSFALDYLKDDSFFMMIEGAQIDNFGHLNDLKGVAEETIDLDHTIQKAIQFADENGETLVIVTADHETGGLTLPHGQLHDHELEGDFSTHDHTGVMVPVFAYGPSSSTFQGVYENNEIFHKILQALKIQNQ